MGDVVISVEGLSKEYRLGTLGRRTLATDLERWWARRRGKEEARGGGRFLALKDVSFDVARGDVVGLIGRNGAGKSTLLRILSRLTAPTRGSVRIKGRVAGLLEVGTGFHPELTGRENVHLNGAILGMSGREIARKFDEIVAFSEVERFIDTPVKRYSSGMYVRLAFAVAAHLEPEILLIDEVLAVGDAQFQRKCLGRMGTVAREGRTVLFVSHNMAAIQNVCGKGIVLKDGTVDFHGPVGEAVPRYLESTVGRERSDLGETAERVGNGRVRITGASTCDLSSRPVQGIPIGEGCRVSLSYESVDGYRPANVEVGVAFISLLGEKVVMFSNVVAGYPFEKLPPRGTISCTIPSLPVAEGSYLVGLSFSSDGETNDWVDRAFPFTVYPSDFYGTGRLYHPGSTHLYLPHSWEIS